MIPIRDDNPVSKPPIATVLIIVTNVVVFIYQFLLPDGQGQAMILRLGVIPYEITHFQDFNANPATLTPFPNFLTLITSLFLHGGVFHIGSNMLFLWIFGDNIEELMGSFRFVFFYLLAGVIAAGAQIIMAPSSTIPMVGASGAIAGVLGAYFLKFPRARVQVLFIFFFFIQIFRVPAVIVLGFWFIMQIFSGFTSISALEMGGVAWFAHIGGFIAGLILVNRFQKREAEISF